ncbi:Homeobox-leucine zipper protein HDG1 [Hibiscus syriacus]|uniref:Homeobox-leucine zipper protein HDG1 n=1 Tax=Hibiscus syriacus TaxID=106335 RepID=A0A6A2WQD6_HIBSY|nr:homeobox-leucine zipper protein ANTHOCYANINLESS 2-like [Hibiscus syriacus]KAE8662121.1 Homeobox-leucine zipper protein HDG1 [Hibiscus syriacus]
MSFGGLIKSGSTTASCDGFDIVARILVADIVPYSNMLSAGGGDAIFELPPPLLTQHIPLPMQSSPSLSLPYRTMDQLGGNFDPGLVGRMREDENESRSGSDNIEGASGDDQAADGRRPKKYHRHTPHQIQELESFFKECPHPDEKQRMELSRRLGLEIKQIKFWFQNRRTQMKTQLERHENVILRQDNDKLRAENDFLKQAMISPVCSSCGGPAVPGEISYEQHQLKIENARLKDELSRVCSLTNKFLGWPASSSASPIASQGLNSNLELAMGRNGFGGLNNAGTSLPMEFNFCDGAMLPLMKSRSNEMPYDRSAIVNVALAALDELIKLAQMDNPLWIKDLDGGIETLNLEEYSRSFSSCSGMKPSGYTTEATRETGLVSLGGLALVEALIDTTRWAEMFPCLVSRAATIDVLSTGTGVARDNTLQVMDAEFQVLSPLVPARRVRFIRFCKQHSEGVWAVVDVSINTTQDAANTHTFINCRRLPSGCVIQDLDNKYSKVTWIEHSEYDESSVHHLLRPLLSSGLGFGAHRWISTLQRQCDCLALLMSPGIPGEDNIGITPAGRKSMLKLAQRMTNNFCAGVCASSVFNWETFNGGSVIEDMRIMSRKNVNDPGEPQGVLLCAATSVWMPAAQKRLFDFLRDERMRIQWDILSNGGPMQEMVNIAKGPGHDNSVSLLRGSAINANENTMLILQETWYDASGALVIYAPVDISSMSIVMNGGDSAYVALLPSGFAILPHTSPSYHGRQSNSNGQMVKPDDNGSISTSGCILTVGFQILVNSVPTAKLTMESVETVNNLISCTIKKIRAALTVT